MRSEEKEKFLSRWSRRKQQAREQPAAVEEQKADPEESPPELPPVEELTIDSDYRDFFHPKVDENLRRNALKKLFSDPHFSVIDGLDIYLDDYSKPSPMPAAMLAGLKQAQNILEWARQTTEETARQEKAARLAGTAGTQELTDEGAPAGPAPAPAPERTAMQVVGTQQSALPSDGKS